VTQHANALLLLADILEVGDLGDDAAVARSEAVAKLRAKGNLAAVARLTG
jgi:predicted hotdog family 3-hydroxylacyl-ACP dehydratase